MPSALPKIVKHLLQVVALITNGINDHVPLAERAIDTNTINRLHGLLHKIRNRSRQDTSAVRTAFHHIPWKQKLRTASRVVMSQTPLHNPAEESTPPFADRWVYAIRLRR